MALIHMKNALAMIQGQPEFITHRFSS